MSIKGWVYVMSNRAMPSMVKVGYSTKDPALRAKELNNTGVPYTYQVDFEILVVNPANVEQMTHEILEDFRAGKEWFRCELIEAIAAIKKACGNEFIVEYQHRRENTGFNGASASLDEQRSKSFLLLQERLEQFGYRFDGDWAISSHGHREKIQTTLDLEQLLESEVYDKAYHALDTHKLSEGVEGLQWLMGRETWNDWMDTFLAVDLDFEPILQGAIGHQNLYGGQGKDSAQARKFYDFLVTLLDRDNFFMLRCFGLILLSKFFPSDYDVLCDRWHTVLEEAKNSLDARIRVSEENFRAFSHIARHAIDSINVLYSHAIDSSTACAGAARVINAYLDFIACFLAWSESLLREEQGNQWKYLFQLKASVFFGVVTGLDTFFSTANVSNNEETVLIEVKAKFATVLLKLIKLPLFIEICNERLNHERLTRLRDNSCDEFSQRQLEEAKRLEKMLQGITALK